MIDIKKIKIYSENKNLVDISFKIVNSTALIGESGSGKSLTLKALLNLLPKSLKIEKEIVSDFELNFDNIGFIPQNPFTSLSSMTKIKNQFFCTNEKKEQLFKLLNLDLNILNKYPSQISGGQTQRVVIAMALSKDAKILLLDEPTTALDEDNKANIINTIKDLQNRLKIKILFVTHDISSIKEICEDIVILRNGTVVECGSSKQILENPKATYTKQLIDSSFENKEFRK